MQPANQTSNQRISKPKELRAGRKRLEEILLPCATLSPESLSIDDVNKDAEGSSQADAALAK